MKEEFLDVPVFNKNSPYEVCLAGTSYCDGTYHINRPNPEGFCVLEYIISGKGTVKVKGKTYRALAGDTYLLIPDEAHEYYSDEDDPWVKIWINASGKLVYDLIDAYSLGEKAVFRCNSLPYIRKIHDTLADKTLSVDEITEKCEIYFHSICQLLYKHNQHEKVCPEAEMLKNYIDKNIGEALSVEKLASLIYKSRSQTIRIFKGQYGVTPYDYYMEKRIEKACTLLKNTTYSVKQVAFSLGFCDEHYFSGVFRNKTGKTPTEYRNFYNQNTRR